MMNSFLFVCTGNICRSPTAEAVFRYLLERKTEKAELVNIDSAGTSAWHEGSPPDKRAQKAAKKRGYDMSKLISRPVTKRDFVQFDLLIAMDCSHFQWLMNARPQSNTAEIRKLLEFGNSNLQEVPDPYYGAKEQFEYVLDLIEDASQGLIDTYFPK